MTTEIQTHAPTHYDGERRITLEKTRGSIRQIEMSCPYWCHDNIHAPSLKLFKAVHFI